MKKLLGTLCVLGVLASFHAIAQGFVTFGGGKNAIFNGTNGTAGLGTGGEAALLWAASGTPDNLSGTAVNALSVPANFWSTILGLTSSGWTIGMNASTSTEAVATVNPSGLAVGGFVYNSATPFQLAGTVGGTTYSMIAVAWNGGYATLQDAATADAHGGVSSIFSYLTGAGASDPNGTVNFTGNGMSAFGVAPVNSVPEPGTLALAALGASSLLLFRRKK